MYSKECKECGKIFQTQYHMTKYCSSVCADKVKKRQKQKWNMNHPERNNKIRRILTDDVIEAIQKDEYDLTSLPYWKTREEETPGYIKSIAILYKNCNFKCEITGQNGLVVHHLNSYHWDVDNRCNPNNMIVIHKAVHDFFHFLYGYNNNTIEQFDEFLNLHFCTSVDNIYNRRGWICN